MKRMTFDPWYHHFNTKQTMRQVRLCEKTKPRKHYINITK